ncbi:MAG: GreA/GreB family elongation factor [bacterium]|nr:GreA/GreB family elongation factor [bacterium]
MSKIPFTKVAYQQMQQDLDQALLEEKDILIRLQAAREMGDLSENGAYQYAKFELGNIRRKIRKLKPLLENGEIIENTPTGVATFGSTITLTNAKTTKKFMLVTKHESNPTENKLSIESPFGQAVVGKKIGDEVEIIAPAGVIRFTVASLE